MILALEGFTLPSGYLVKELSVCLENYEIHFYFKAPTNFEPSAKDLQTIRYASKHVNHLTLHDDNVLPYEALDVILQSLASKTIYVAGNSAYQFVAAKLPTTLVFDISSVYNFKYPKELPDTTCAKRHGSRYCSLAKCLCIKQFMEKLKYV